MKYEQPTTYRSQFFIIALSLFMLAPSYAQSESNEELARAYWSVQIENDTFGSGEDRFYTNGFQVSRLKQEAGPAWLQRMAQATPLYVDNGKTSVRYSLGQAMFTPGDKDIAELIEDDRPYAGWLYGSIGIASLTEETPDFRALTGLELKLGMVGPSSLAEQTQNKIHQLIGADRSEGWDNQLGDEPGIVLTWARKWEYLGQLNGGLEYSMSPHAVVALGNVYTYGGSGIMFRLGRNLRNDIGPPNINPGFPGSAMFAPGKGPSWYLFTGFEGRAVVRNIFLDGNTFKDSHSVDKKPLVGDLQFGIAWQTGNMRFAFSNVIRSKEFDGQGKYTNYGALNVSWYLR